MCFFFKQKTAYEMRISDWSSDVCSSDLEIIDRALSLQNGNRGFGHEIPCLLILCTDLSAFDTAGERYQHWIDGGMFSMSLVWALHALGYSSCCLNWSKTQIGRAHV